MPLFLCRGCRQPVHLRTVRDEPIPEELQYCPRCEQLRARFERNLEDARAGKGIPNSDYWYDKTGSEAGPTK